MALDPLSMAPASLGDSMDSLLKAPKGPQYAQADPTIMTDARPVSDIGERKKAASREQFDIQAQLDALTEQEKAAKKGASAAKEAALGRRYGEIRAQYEPELQKPAPEFTPSKETVANLGSLGGMLMVIGAMSGSKGMVGATGAMNAMAGMLKGYQDGRKELFDREKATFEQNFKVWQANRTLIKETFDRAIKFAPYDLQKATNDAVAKLKSAGATTLAASVQKNGLQQTAAAVQQADAQFNQVAMPIVNQITSAQFPLGATTQRAPMAAPPAVGQMTKAQLQRAQKEAEQREKEIDIEAKYPAVKKSDLQVAMNPDTGKLGFWNSTLRRFETDDKGRPIEAKAAMRRNEPLSEKTLERKAFSIANYSEKPPALRDANRDVVMDRVYEINPNFNEGDFGNRQIAERNWTNPNGTGAKNLAATATVANHLFTLRTLADAVDAGDTPAINRVVQYVQRNLGYPEVTNFDAAKQAVSAEIVKAITGTAGALADRKEAESILDPAKSPAQIKGAINTIEDLIGGRLEVMMETYRTGTGRSKESFIEKLPQNVKTTFGKYVGLTEPRPTTTTTPTRTLSPQDQQALDWANANPNDPRSIAIKERLGVQ